MWGNRIWLAEVCSRLDEGSAVLCCVEMNERAYLVLPIPALHPLADGEVGEALLSGTTHVIHANALIMKEKKNERINEQTNERIITKKK